MSVVRTAPTDSRPIDARAANARAADVKATDFLVELVDTVAKTGTHPVDAMHVAAILEMNGWTDHRAVEVGYEDVFALADAVYQLLRARFYRQLAPPSKKPHWLYSILHTIRLYLRGLSFAMPMLLSSASVLTLEYSIWSYVGFSTEIATGIALGTFFSFLVVGGFSQSIARRGLFYLSQKLYGLARRSSVQLLVVGTLVAFLVGLLGMLMITFVPVLPWSIVRVGMIYYFLLSLIWLGASLLYMLEQEMVILSLIAAGIGAVYVEVEILKLEMMQAQIIAMSAIAVGYLLVGLLVLLRLERKDESEASARSVMPRWSQVTRSLAPYFLYGATYFSVLFVDRLMAWSVPGEFHPYVIWFLGDYELGMDWALWTLVAPMGLVEVYIHVMFYRIRMREQIRDISEIAAFNRRFRREHLQIMALVSVGGLLSIAGIHYVMYTLQGQGVLPIDPLANDVTRFVFFVAAPVFSLVTVGLQNVLVLFSLNVPWPVVRSTGIACAANLVVGFLASRYGGHQWAVLGFAVGAVLFAVLSYRDVHRVFGELDYHLMRAV